MRSEGYGSSVCVCVCLSVKSHLTSGASVRPENSATYSEGNEGPNICGVFSETSSFQSYGTFCVVRLPYEPLKCRRLSKPNMGNSIV